MFRAKRQNKEKVVRTAHTHILFSSIARRPSPTLVSEDQKTGWEEYAVQHQGWIQDGLDRQGLGKEAAPITEYIFKRNEVFVIPGDGVTWQIAPAPDVPALVNYNSLSGGFSKILDYFNQFHAEVLTRILEHS